MGRQALERHGAGARSCRCATGATQDLGTFDLCHAYKGTYRYRLRETHELSTAREYRRKLHTAITRNACPQRQTSSADTDRETPGHGRGWGNHL